MLTTKQKIVFKVFSWFVVLIMLSLPTTAYARGHKGGDPFSSRQQAAQSFERGTSGTANNSSANAPSESSSLRREQGLAQIQERFNFSGANKQFGEPVRGFDRPQQHMANRGNETGPRFDNTPPPQVKFNDSRPQHTNHANRNWNRIVPNVEKSIADNSDNRLSPQPNIRPDKIFDSLVQPALPPEKPSGKDGRRSGIRENGHNSDGTSHHKSPEIDKQSRKSDDDSPKRGNGTIDTRTTPPVDRTAGVSPDTTTKTEGFRRHYDGNWSQAFDKDIRTRHQRNWDTVSVKLVADVPDAITTQRTSFWRNSGNFSRYDGYCDRTIFRHRNDFVFFGRHHRHRFASHRIITPDFFFVTYFNFGPWCVYRPIYPYYHRRYIFVNPCGYWPYNYSYVRYYWYSCYPYSWYGYNPVPYEYGDTYNYYTYNYYGSDGPANSTALSNQPNYSVQQPLSETTADQYFDEGVKAFEAGDYNTAIAKFALARQQAPDDKIIAFAYSQAYFASGDYKSAAQVLRAALAKVDPVTEGVFYPRGLYSDDDILLKQVEALSNAARLNRQDLDMQFLLGYQYLGLGELDEAAEPLKNASYDSLNSIPANALLQLLDKLMETQGQESNSKI